MKHLLIVLGLVLVCSFTKAQVTKSKKEIVHTISGKVTQTSSYCGGAMPTEEILQEMSKPVPYAGKVFYVRKGSVNNIKMPIVLSFTVNAKGEFSIDLPPGQYCLIQKEQVKTLNMKNYKSTTDLQIDENCLKEWWAKPYYAFQITDKNITDLKFNFYHACFVNSDIPCIEYVGPMPP